MKDDFKRERGFVYLQRTVEMQGVGPLDNVTHHYRCNSVFNP